MNPSAVQNAIAYIEELFSANADGHDAAHSLRVYKNALRIARSYPECDEQAVALSALLHDADDHKLFATENNANARRFLASQGLGSSGIERICAIINGVSFSKNRGKRPESLEGMIVQDADRLDALGAVGIARTFAYGGKHGRSLEASLEHFYDKLLLLKDEMNTPEAARLAKERHYYLLGFIERFKEETGAESR
ncbi:MAG: HD domain-containing protein [Clostridia bacterium]|nr:HD domain-containing protein [Clostridia bacterium]